MFFLTGQEGWPRSSPDLHTEGWRMVLPAFGRVRVHAHTPALQGLGQAVTCTHLSSAPTAVKCHGSLVPEGFYIPNFPKLQVFSTPVVSHRRVASSPAWPSTGQVSWGPNQKCCAGARAGELRVSA